MNGYKINELSHGSLDFNDSLIFKIVKTIFASTVVRIYLRDRKRKVIISDTLLELLSYCNRLILLTYADIIPHEFSRLTFTLIITEVVSTDIMTLKFCALKILPNHYIGNLDYRSVRIIDIVINQGDPYKDLFPNAVYIGGIGEEFPNINFDWDMFNLKFNCDIGDFEQDKWYDITTELLEHIITVLDRFNNRGKRTKRAI